MLSQRRGPHRQTVIAALVGLLVGWLGIGFAAAHPGRLDAEGCHRVQTRSVHRSGKVDEPGTVHCHRAKAGRPMVLDGREQLADPAHPDEDAPRDDAEPGPVDHLSR